MEKYTSAEDIYDELVENSEESWILGLVAFAVVEEQRIEWIKHQKANNGGSPDTGAITAWYEQLPQGVLLRAKDTAESRLKDYSDEIVSMLEDDYRKEIQESIIVNEIKESKKFWPQFGVNLAGGFVSALLFAALLSIVAFFVINDTSPVEIGSELRNNVEESTNGQERSNE